MTAEKTLLAKGAEVNFGRMFLKHQCVGIYTASDFIVTPEGEAALQIEDVEFKEVAPVVTAPARKTPARKTAPEPVQPPEPASEVEDLLAGLDKLEG